MTRLRWLAHFFDIDAYTLADDRMSADFRDPKPYLQPRWPLQRKALRYANFSGILYFIVTHPLFYDQR